MDEREATWGRLHEAMPARWTVGQPSYDPGRPGWSISAVGPDRGRGKVPTSVSGLGESELAAVRDLDARLRGARSEGPRRLDETRQRLRLAYFEGAESWARQELERPLKADELERVISRFPGALAAQASAVGRETNSLRDLGAVQEDGGAQQHDR